MGGEHHGARDAARDVSNLDGQRSCGGAVRFPRCRSIWSIPPFRPAVKVWAEVLARIKGPRPALPSVCCWSSVPAKAELATPRTSPAASAETEPILRIMLSLHPRTDVLPSRLTLSMAGERVKGRRRAAHGPPLPCRWLLAMTALHGKRRFGQPQPDVLILPGASKGSTRC